MTRDIAEQSTLSISIELSPELSPFLDAHTAMNSAVCEAAGQALAALMAELGVPGRVGVTISEHTAPADKILRVLVDGRPTRYPDDVLQLTYAYVNRQLLDPDVKSAAIVDWLKARCESAAGAGRETGVEFVCASCLEIVKLQPAVLLGPMQANAYAEALAGELRKSSGFTPPDPEHLTVLLGSLLEMGISITNVPAVAEVLARESKPGDPPELVIEHLVDALRAKSVDILLPRLLLQQVTTRWEKEGLEVFPTLRDGLFVELGVELPPLRFAAFESLKPDCFAFKVNHLASPPLRGLDSDRCLINQTPERASLGSLTASPATNPASGQPGSVIDLGEESKAQSLGLTTRNQLQYLILCLEEFLRRRAWCTVHRGGVTDQLRAAEQYFPSLVSAFRSRHADEELTTVLRALVRDRVSVQNLRVILERWLDYDILRGASTPSEPERDAALSDAVAFARVGLGHEIAHRAARSTDTAVVYLMDAEIERIVSGRPYSALGERGDDILRALRAEMAYLPATALLPSILTFVEARSALQRLINSEFPRMSVIAHEELPPGVNVQPVARISLAS